MAEYNEERSQVAMYRGAVVLKGHMLERLCHQHAPFTQPLGFPLHITLLTKSEYHNVGKPALPALNLAYLRILGLGSSRSGSVRWLIVVWNHGNVYRKMLKLPNKDFHITVTDEDDHNIGKGIMSLDEGREAILRAFANLDEDGMDHVLASQPTPLHTEFAIKMVQQYIGSYKSHIRFGDQCFDIVPKIAMLAYARALALNPGMFTYIKTRLMRMSHRVTWGPLLTKDESERLRAFDGLGKLLLRPWEGEITEICNQILWTAPSESRERMTYLGRKFPRFFTWLYPHRLAGMSTPCSEADIDLLMDMGITVVVTLTQEQPLESDWFKFKPIENIYIPIENYGVPTLAEMDIIYKRFKEDGHGRWLIHCGGGKGRAGTVLSCLIAMLGYGHEATEGGTPKMDKSSVIREIRRMRPGSIESEKQERFVGTWISHRWAKAREPDDPAEPITILDVAVDPKIFPNGLDHEKFQVCFLVGNPGSGKSWLAQSIAKRRSNPTIIISQDESRSRQACERAIGQSHRPGTLLILDRCNPGAKERKDWLSLPTTIQSPIAIYFDYPKAVCLQRINSRLNHPTIRPGHGTPHLEQMSRTLTAPTLAEGFSAILTINSLTASRSAIHLLTGAVPILKFPRTPHLLDLGATSPDDIVLSPESVAGNLIIEEKIDGANMGFSLDWDGQIVVQNRSHCVSSADHAQFRSLDAWVERHRSALRRLLERDAQFPERFVLYGEWVVAKHSIHYTHLPDSFLAFDLFDRVGRNFVSRRVLEGALRGSGISVVPVMRETKELRREELEDLVQAKSAYYEGRVEGIYIRWENEERTQTMRRGKVVRSDFLAGDVHWNKGPLVLNGITRRTPDGA